MAFKLTRRSIAASDSPDALFRDLRKRQVAGLLSHQADMLREYQSWALDSRDVALQLPTGSGKTLVGLLIGEWRRRSFQEKVVYLCPTRQLVHQVVNQSLDKYGIKANAFVGRQNKYEPGKKAEYESSETLAVTAYSGLFNTNPYFSDADVLILDDVHAAESYIASYWAVSVDRRNEKHKTLFDSIVSIISPKLQLTDRIRLRQADKRRDAAWVEKLPTPHFESVLGELTAAFDEHTGDCELQYAWSVIRDHIYACHLYLSINAILVRPFIPPTQAHEAFASPKQRVYMSATLSECGDLERTVGVRKIERLPVPKGWDKQGIGRRLFFFSERSLLEDEATQLAVEMCDLSGRSLVLVPDDRSEEEFKKLAKAKAHPIFDADEMERSKDSFIASANAVAVIANRYDGIDMLNDECRLLIVKGVPRATNLQERFIVTRLAAALLLNERILTRVIQAFGRCTRSATDYSAVVVLGEELLRFLSDPKRLAFLHPEIQAELQFGLDESKGMKPKGFLENLKVFFDHGDDWNAADEVILANRSHASQQKLPAADKLMASVASEVDYQYALWKGDFSSAIEKCQKVLTELSGDDVKGYRAFWNYLCGSAAWLGAKGSTASLASVARENYRRAAGATKSVKWLIELTNIETSRAAATADDSCLATLVEGLESQLESHGVANDRKFEAEISAIIKGLQSEDPDQFEIAHTKLGNLLGYTAERPTSTAAPDSLWQVETDFYLVFEDHDPKEADSLGANKVRQAASHRNWLMTTHNISSRVEVASILITSAAKIQRSALPHAGEVLHWPLEQFRQWAARAISVVREQRRTFPGSGDIDWRGAAVTAYGDAGLAPRSIVDNLKQTPVKKMPVA